MLESNRFSVKRCKGGSGTNAIARDGRRFGLKRDEYIWRVKEALDPEHGDNVALPPGRHILMQLTSYRERRHGEMRDVIKIESNDEIVKRIGRSPDDAWAIFFAWAEPDQEAKEKRVSHVAKRGVATHTPHVTPHRSKVIGRR
jgi:hypothetical protein